MTQFCARSFFLGLTCLVAGALTHVVALEQAQACQCPAQTFDDHVKAADVIVYGKVLNFSEVEDNDWRGSVSVLKSYKGILGEGDIVVVRTPPVGNCGLSLKANRAYMIYASRKKDHVSLNLCAPTRPLRRAPIAPGITSILPRPVGPGSVAQRLARASDVAVVKVTEAGVSYAGSWHNVKAQGTITTSFRGQKKGKIQIALDERACGKKKLNFEDDALKSQGGPKLKKGASYLMFTYGDSPTRVAPCHGNLVEVSQATKALEELKALCKGKVCHTMGAATLQAAALRKALKKQVFTQAKSTLSTCHKKHAKGGVITDITFDVALLPGGKKASVRELKADGTIEDASVYDAFLQCVVDTTQSSWKLTPIQGDPVRANMVFKLDPKRARRPKFTYEQFTLKPDKKER